MRNQQTYITPRAKFKNQIQIKITNPQYVEVFLKVCSLRKNPSSFSQE